MNRLFRQTLICLVICSFLITACNKKEVQFGAELPDSVSRILYIDTVTPFFSTLVLDSFPTSGNKIMFIGRCDDPLMGPTSAQTYFNVELPASAKDAEIPEDARFDSLVLVLQAKNHWYGDTSKPLTFSAYEMEEISEFPLGSNMYNTTSFPWLPNALGSVTRTISPSSDSLLFRIRSDKANEFFQKIRDKAAEFKTDDGFLNYFRGITIRVNDNDKGAVFAFKTDSGTMMRLHYTTYDPYPVKQTIEFRLTRPEYQFNQLITDRSKTPLKKMYDEQEEYFPSEEYPYVFTQTGTGVMTKITFPSLKNIKSLGKTVKLLDAKLELRPIENTFDPYDFPLSKSLYLAHTDETNITGQQVSDGKNALVAWPQIDNQYHLNTNYTFDLTYYLTGLLSYTGQLKPGMFLMEESPGTGLLLNRSILGTHEHPRWKSVLKLTVLTTTQ
ncbi:DUF4270 domain-containing protein [Pseudoflavitalea sp. G-6-1-2]|uniref:DUF4270 family protein n=1 Tax=Pseudoflavitalea sp. G-6-1-2 TaxID=2728841 RepID=UPI00146E1B62|nr:DUF4270 family protein [Pseudoflavitalea sp. G-6-1-2]NML22977.1 DUF4270 domain-containing protein [Pseudoflavitalea sp. G-6-1-2]